MATGTAALAQKLVSRKSATTSTTTKKSLKKPSVKSKSNGSATKSRADIPWQKIADLYNAGHSVPEISDGLKLTRPKTKKGKENPYPYYLTVGYLTKLSHGVEINGKTLKIVRGAKNTKRASAREKE